MDVDVDNNQYDLIVTTVDETDAGTYVAGFLVLQDKQEAQLVILGWCNKVVNDNIKSNENVISLAIIFCSFLKQIIHLFPCIQCFLCRCAHVLPNRRHRIPRRPRDSVQL